MTSDSKNGRDASKANDYLPNCVLFDLDGTLANCDHRRVHITKKPKDWQAFNACMANDTVHANIFQLMNILKGSGWKVVICTGREAAYRDVTIAWLRKWNIWFDAIYMRAEKDYRADDIIKSELLDRILADGFSPWLVVDDRDRVVAMWRSRGLTCLQCAPGDF